METWPASKDDSKDHEDGFHFLEEKTSTVGLAAPMLFKCWREAMAGGRV
jgi:hypothetical protein